MTSFAVIPAKGNSSRIPRKNAREFCGKPIIAYSIETAKACGLFERVYVSTDDAGIAEIARQHGAAVLKRPKELTLDSVGTQEVVRFHAKEDTVGRAVYLCCIYPTAPMLEPLDLREGFMLLERYGADYAFSIGTDPLRDAGAYYWGQKVAFVQERPLFGPDTLMVPLPNERVCDINTVEDFQKAEGMYRAMMKARP